MATLTGKEELYVQDTYNGNMNAIRVKIGENVWAPLYLEDLAEYFARYFSKNIVFDDGEIVL